MQDKRERRKIVARSLPLVLLLLFAATNAYAQFPDSLSLSDIALARTGSRMIHFHSYVNIPALGLFGNHGSKFGLGDYDHMILLDSTTDDYGFTHFKFGQKHKGYPIDGAEYIVHERGGRSEKANGFIMSGLDVPVGIVLTAEQALTQAMLYIGADEYMWEDSLLEAWLREEEGDSSATYYPVSRFFITAPDGPFDTLAFRLTYRFGIAAKEPHSINYVFVDAINGSIINSESMEFTADANVLYYGWQQIETSVFETSYQLLDPTRSDGIWTRSKQGRSGISKSHIITDDDDYWDDEPIGTAAHWAVEQSYDYFATVHKYYGLNGSGHIVKCDVDVIIGGDPNNARFFTNVWSETGTGSGGRIQLGTGDGTNLPPVSYSVSVEPTSVCTADFDNDGDLDLAAACNYAPGYGIVSVLINTGDGTYEDAVSYQCAGDPSSICASNLDDDGFCDLVVASRETNNLSLLWNDGDGTFTSDVNAMDVSSTPSCVASDDLNGDFINDLVVANAGSNNLSLIINNGDRTFQDQVTETVGDEPMSLEVCDLDRDSDPDIAVVNFESNDLYILRNNGSGVFTVASVLTTGDGPVSVRAGEFGSGFYGPDLVVANLNSNNVTVFLNDDADLLEFDETAESDAGSEPTSVAVAFFDVDGVGDLAVTHGDLSAVSIMYGDGAGYFVPSTPVPYQSGLDPCFVVAGDFDDDSKFDIAVANNGSDDVSLRFNIDEETTYNPLVALDVVAHEFTHAVTTHTSRLRNRNESGALGEAFSDIFATAVEFWAQDESWQDWLIGEDVVVSDWCYGNQYMRNMADPGQSCQPSTYGPADPEWETGSDDNGGVHTNNGVLCYWFYLLSEGGVGTNANEQDYTVQGIGIEKAAKIAFRILTDGRYLSRRSEYIDARDCSIEAAKDIYGDCSQEYLSVLGAWFAVGLGNETTITAPLISAHYFYNGSLNVENSYAAPGIDCSISATVQVRFTGETVLEQGSEVNATIDCSK